MGLRDIESTLPPGFRFFPSDEELVCHYLRKKVANEGVSGGTMVEVDLHTLEPWELPELAKLSETEWYFFSFRDRKYATGSRTNRATKSGYWKATGKDRVVYDPATSAIVGMRKTLVFYRGRAPNGVKTNWIMHEFRLETPNTPPKEDWVLCRVFHKKIKGDEHQTSFWSERENNLLYSTACSSSTRFMESSHTPIRLFDDHLMDDQNACYEQILSTPLAAVAAVEHQDHGNSPNSFLQLSALVHQNFFDFPQEEVNRCSNAEKATADLGSRGAGDDEYNGLILDVPMLEEEQYHTLAGGGMAFNLGSHVKFHQGGKDDQLFL